MENITVFEDLPPRVSISSNSAMELDDKEEEVQEKHQGPEVIDSLMVDKTDATNQVTFLDKAIKSDESEILKENEPEIEQEMNTLYPIFWALQESFSTPTRLFNSQNFRVFKEGLGSTLRKFQMVHQELQARGPSKQMDENKRVLKRKRSSADDQISNSFNPRYLTSRDLFDLEVCIRHEIQISTSNTYQISDIAFRRHILVQALILVDFLLSLTPKAKKKLEHTTNKSVLYSFTLNEEDVS